MRGRERSAALSGTAAAGVCVEQRKPPRRKIPPISWLLVLFPVALLMSWLAKNTPELAEQVFALGVYRWVSNGLSRVTGLLPFSLLEFGIIALVLLTVGVIVWFVRGLIRRKGYRAAFAGWVGFRLLCLASAGYFVFTLLCGVNYYRSPFSRYSGLEIRPSTADELAALCCDLAQEANELRAQITNLGEDGTPAVFHEGYRAVSDQARSAMKTLAAQYPVLEGYYPPVKRVLFSGFMSRTQLTGVYCPFTMEANVNVACTEYTIPATMCHELSHLRGFMREDEANFIAYLACMCSDSVEFRYSGTMLALVYAGNQLYRVDQDRYRELIQSYSEGVRLDLTVDSAYWRQFDDTVISTVSNSVNDAYLKANDQHDGVQSYGRMVDLLLALYRENA